MSLELEDQYEKIYRYCCFKVNNVQLAEDLTQETFLHYFQQNTYINKGKTLAYLYTIARNLCIDSCRRRVNVPMEEYALEQYLEKEAVSHRDEHTALENRLVCRQAIATLPADQQELLLLRFCLELDFMQIKALTGLSRFCARRRLNAAIDTLRGILKEEDFT